MTQEVKVLAAKSEFNLLAPRGGRRLALCGPLASTHVRHPIAKQMNVNI